MDSENDLFRASLESIKTGKRADRFKQFIAEFSKECDVSLNNAQEWIKAELPLVTNHIDLAPIQEELKSNRVSSRRRHLLSALVFEQATRYATTQRSAASAALMAMHMLNHIWKAKLELFKTQSSQSTAEQDQHVDDLPPADKSAPEKEFDLRREQILTALIEKGEMQKHISKTTKKKSLPKAPKKPIVRKEETTKKKPIKRVDRDLWKETKDSTVKKNRLVMSSNKKKFKKKNKGVFSKVKSRIPMKKGTRPNQEQDQRNVQKTVPHKKPHDSLLDNPNNSAIMVNPGFAESLEDSIIQARPGFSNDPNESGITVRKVLKKREHETHEPGSNTIIMKLASSAGKKPEEKNQTGLHLSIPERCQRAVNKLSLQYPGYDMVAIRNLAAKKVGVSAQYIENLNILPEQKNR